MFRPFIDQLKKRLQEPLPGEDIQFAMAPLARERIREIPKENYHPRKSAVLILLFPANNSVQTVLIERPVYEGVHSGQIAFPGGRFEDTDADLQQTALRETFEEVGVQPGSIEILGRLTDLYISPSNFLVSPFIGYTAAIPDFIPDAREVQSIIITDLFSMGAMEKGVKTITHSSGFKIKTPYYEIEGFTVWGATAMMISELNAVIAETNVTS